MSEISRCIYHSSQILLSIICMLWRLFVHALSLFIDTGILHKIDISYHKNVALHGR